MQQKLGCRRRGLGEGIGCEPVSVQVNVRNKTKWPNEIKLDNTGAGTQMLEVWQFKRILTLL